MAFYCNNLSFPTPSTMCLRTQTVVHTWSTRFSPSLSLNSFRICCKSMFWRFAGLLFVAKDFGKPFGHYNNMASDSLGTERGPRIQPELFRNFRRYTLRAAKLGKTLALDSPQSLSRNLSKTAELVYSD